MRHGCPPVCILISDGVCTDPDGDYDAAIADLPASPGATARPRLGHRGGRRSRITTRMSCSSSVRPSGDRGAQGRLAPEAGPLHRLGQRGRDGGGPRSERAGWGSGTDDPNVAAAGTRATSAGLTGLDVSFDESDEVSWHSPGHAGNHLSAGRSGAAESEHPIAARQTLPGRVCSLDRVGGRRERHRPRLSPTAMATTATTSATSAQRWPSVPPSRNSAALHAVLCSRGENDRKASPNR